MLVSEPTVGSSYIMKCPCRKAWCKNEKKVKLLEIVAGKSRNSTIYRFKALDNGKSYHLLGHEVFTLLLLVENESNILW